MHFTPNIYCSFKLDRRKGQCFFGDHNAGSLFLIERSLPLIIVIVNVANKKMRQALKKKRQAM